MIRHWELEIKTLQEVPRDADKLRKLLEAKRKEYEEAEDYETIDADLLQRLKCFVLYFMCGKRQ
ncbi:MAG: hypothetical protein M3270_08815 [Thermoproteota archaeon]|nr:hypothetical protein [Thermoproteota archaeon]